MDMDSQDRPGRLQTSVMMIEKRLEVMRKKSEASLLQNEILNLESELRRLEIQQGRLFRHITSPSEKTRPESWPGDYMGKATPVWQLSWSHRCHQM